MFEYPLCPEIFLTKDCQAVNSSQICIRKFARHSAAYSFVLLEIMKRDNWNAISFIYSTARSELLYCHVSAADALIATGLFLLNLYIILIFLMFCFPFGNTYIHELKRQLLVCFVSLNTTNMYSCLLIHVADFFFRTDLNVMVRKSTE